MKTRAGFTLLELLIVIAILGVLVGLLAGGIRKSIDNGKKKNRATEVMTLKTAIMTYWHDTGKPPINITSGTYEYSFSKDNNKVFERLLDPNSKHNPLHKAYLDLNQLRTIDNGVIRPMERASEPVADYKGSYYTVTIDLKQKDAEVK